MIWIWLNHLMLSTTAFLSIDNPYFSHRPDNPRTHILNTCYNFPHWHLPSLNDWPRHKPWAWFLYQRFYCQTCYFPWQWTWTWERTWPVARQGIGSRSYRQLCTRRGRLCWVRCSSMGKWIRFDGKRVWRWEGCRIMRGRRRIKRR